MTRALDYLYSECPVCACEFRGPSITPWADTPVEGVTTAVCEHCDAVLVLIQWEDDLTTAEHPCVLVQWAQLLLMSSAGDLCAADVPNIQFVDRAGVGLPRLAIVPFNDPAEAVQ